MASHDIQLTKQQMYAINSTSKDTLFLAGIGTGKSFLGALWIIKQVLEYPKSKGLIVANTHTQLLNATIHTLTQLLDKFGIPYTKALSGAQKHIKINKSLIYLYSLEKYDNIRGIEVGYILLDEAAFAREEAMKVLKGRLRDKHGPLQCLYTTSPNGFNWLWKKFNGRDGKSATDKICLIRGITKDNIFLPEGYYEDLVEEYGGEDSPLARQELFGEFTSLTGGCIYWAFNRDTNVRDCKLDPKYPVYAGLDFNVENMNCTLIQYIRGRFHVCERIQLNDHNANTYDMADYLLTNYASKYRLIIVPDSTGRSRKSSAIEGQSDHKILTDAGLNVVNTSNPLIRNRQNNVNIKFKKELLYIDPKLNDLILEIESLSSRDKEGDVSHAAVTIGYVLWHLDPLKRERKKTESYQQQL